MSAARRTDCLCEEIVNINAVEMTQDSIMYQCVQTNSVLNVISVIRARRLKLSESTTHACVRACVRACACVGRGCARACARTHAREKLVRLISQHDETHVSPLDRSGETCRSTVVTTQTHPVWACMIHLILKLCPLHAFS